MSAGHRLRARQTAALTLTGLLLTGFLVGCTPPDLPAAVSPSNSVGSGTSSASVAVTPTTSVSGIPTLDIGLDQAPTGFNPYEIADFSPASAAVASLVLPAVSTVSATGSRVLDRHLVTSAAVTSLSPFTVTYKLDRDATWSDGTPITAEDFSYLREEMLTQSGTVDPAGYRLITAIRSKDAGKTVEVVFSVAFEAWATLFSPLLPAHILKDAPGGWATGLSAGIPVSGYRYKLDKYDTTTGEIDMLRNDKYWGTQPGPAKVIMRIGTDAGLTQDLLAGELQAVLFHPAAASAAALAAGVPAARRAVVPLAATTQLIFDSAAGPTADPAVRRAIAAGLDLPAVRSAVAGGVTGEAVPVSSQVSLPGLDEATPVVPLVTDSPSAAAEFLATAGYVRGGLYESRNGLPLRLTLTYSSTDPSTTAAAVAIQSQLGVIGIEIDLVPDAPLSMVGRIAAGSPNLALVTVPRGSSDAVSAASAFSCQPVTLGQTTIEATRTGNLSGYCSGAVQNVLQAALTGQARVTSIDRQLWTDLPVLPIGQPTEIFAVSPLLASVMPARDQTLVYNGVLSGLPNWPTA